METRLRDLERRAKESDGDPVAWAAFLKETLRASGETAAATVLTSVQSDMRSQVLALTEIDEDSRDVMEVMAGMQEQVEDSLTTTALFEVDEENGDVPLPKSEAVLRSIRAQLTPAQAKEVLQFKKPRLVIYPITNAERYLRALHCEACRTMVGQEEPYFAPLVANSLNAEANQDDKILDYRYAIVEGAQILDFHEWDDKNESHPERIDRFNLRFEGSGIQRLSFGAFAVLMMKGLREGRPIGCHYENDSRERDAIVRTYQYTLLQETDEENNGRFVVGRWSGVSRGVGINLRNLINTHNFPCLRLAVTGAIGS